MTVSDYLREWLRGKRPELERSTYEAYTVCIDRHLSPWFDALGKQLDELRPLDVKAYVTEKRTEGRHDGKPGGLAPATVRKHLAILKQALREAALYELIPRSPAEPVRLPRVRFLSEKVRFVPADQCRDILSAFRGHPLFPLVLVTLYYGLRRSEALGLKWTAVDFDRKELHIRHTVVKNLTIEAKDRTKTESSRRTFPLLQSVEDVLAVVKATSTGVSPYVFTWDDGRPFRPDCVTRGFQRALRRAGLPVIRFHDLRHATATVLFEQGWSVKDVQHWLGHSDAETTMNIYIAYLQSRKKALGGAIEGIFESPHTETEKTQYKQK